MPRLPLYKIAYDTPPSFSEQGHQGLWFEKFFDRYDPGWSIEYDTPSLDWLDNFCKKKCGDPAKLSQSACRLRRLGESLDAQCKVFQTVWHFVSGMGIDHPLENGFAWHPTLGVPYLPGCANKGMLNAWMRDWAPDDTLPDGYDYGKLRSLWFEQDGAGSLIFFDALPINPVQLTPDVMTPHGGDWYAKGGTISNVATDYSKIPADWNDPAPHFFLAVQQAEFLFMVAPRTKAYANEAKVAMKLLGKALDEIGAGAKTAVNYGRMTSDKPDSQC